jgi:ubiquinone/menaquinone biosynthesis C-methylase UbiE
MKSEIKDVCKNVVSVFENYAKYYDLLYEDKNYKKEACFIDGLIAEYSRKKKNILELGCGTGRHAIELAKMGYKINGIDFSKEMLDGAIKRLENISEKVSSKISFRFGDVRNFRSSKRYDCVVSLFHIVSYMSTNNDIDSMFKTAGKHLKKGGFFLFDCWYGPAVLTDRPEKRIKKLENKDIRVIRTAIPEIFPNENLVDVNYEISILDKKTKKKEKISEVHRMRYLFKPEIEMFLRNSGLKLINNQEWLTGEKPGFGTWGVCFVAKKIK